MTTDISLRIIITLFIICTTCTGVAIIRSTTYPRKFLNSIILLCLFGIIGISISREVPPHLTTMHPGGEAIQKPQDLQPGLYTLDNVWSVPSETNEVKVAVIQPVRIDSKDPTQRVVVTTPTADHWIVCDVTGSSLIARKYQSATNPFTGIVEVRDKEGKRTISMYLPF